MDGGIAKINKELEAMKEEMTEIKNNSAEFKKSTEMKFTEVLNEMSKIKNDIDVVLSLLR